MTASLAGEFNVQEFSDQGVPLVGGRLYTYVQGTTTQKDAYTDVAGLVPHTYTSDGAGGQYIGLNARGELPSPLYLASGSYDICLKRADGSTVWTRRADGIGNDLAASTGATLVGAKTAGTGAAASTVQALFDILFTGYVYRGPWAASTAYSVRDVVSSGGIYYECTSAHTSGVSLTVVGGVPFMKFSGGRRGSEVDGGFGVYAVHDNHTTINRHAFEDWSHLDTTDTAQGYASFDAKPRMHNTLAQDHMVGFQSRPIFAGSATLTRFSAHDSVINVEAGAAGSVTQAAGYQARSAHSGAGTISDLIGVVIEDDTGTGTITTQTGLLIKNLTRGTVNYGIYQQAGNAKNYFGGLTHTFKGAILLEDATGAGISYGNDTLGKSITYGYGTAGTANFGTHNFYDGKTTAVLSMNQLRASFGVAVGLKSYTYANLPTGSSGDVVFCTNGRKAGEGVGAGTGVPVYYSTTGSWCSFRTDTTVLA